MVTYHSSRGRSPEIRFGDTLLGGLADGGLYLPAAWPELTKTEGDYASIATAVMAPFVADAIGLDDFGSMVEDAYAAFSDPQVCPLVEREPGHHLLGSSTARPWRSKMSLCSCSAACSTMSWNGETSE